MRATLLAICSMATACSATLGPGDPLAQADEDDPMYEAALEWAPDPELDSDVLPCDPGFEDCDGLDELDVEEEGAEAPASGIVAASRRAWPNGIIPYVIADSVDRSTRISLGKAMTNWSVQTENRIRFRARRASDDSYVRIVGGANPMLKGGTGYRPGNVQTMILRDNEYITVIKHELGHVIGFDHEHKRDERRNYIDVTSGNIINSSLCEYQFAVGSFERPVPYDRVSVMHYRTSDLSRCRTGPVLTRLDGSRIDHVWKLSRKDLDAVAKMYDAGGSCRAETTTQLCTRKGKECGALTATDNCGSSRTVDCGVCTGAELAAWLDSLEENGSIGSKGLCASVPDASTIDGTRITSAACRDGDEQDWRTTRDRQLKIKHSLGCAAVAGGSIVGAKIVQRTCAGDDTSQKWRLRGMEIVNGKTGECVSIPGANYVSGQQVQISACTGEGKQKFNYRPDTEEIKVSGLCFTPQGGAVAGNPVVLRPCDGRVSQRWFQARGGFVNRADTSQCMRVDGGALASGRIEVRDCNDLTGQRWGLRGPIRDFRSELCVQGSATPGTELELAKCDGSARQQWTFWSR